MPGFTVVSAFAALRPAQGITVSVYAHNLFNKLGIFEVNQAAVPTTTKSNR